MSYFEVVKREEIKEQPLEIKFNTVHLNDDDIKTTYKQADSFID